MIRQYLSSTNEGIIMSILQNFLQLNKILPKIKWLHRRRFLNCVLIKNMCKLDLKIVALGPTSSRSNGPSMRFFKSIF